MTDVGCTECGHRFETKKRWFDSIKCPKCNCIRTITFGRCVPTIDEIEQRKLELPKEIRGLTLLAEKDRRPNIRVCRITTRDPSSLLEDDFRFDNPYWGTEFSECSQS